ncbi:MAG: hypothetical protein MUP27_09200 [Desulfobacterales bacterium]|nr:hypothetical protein [Desulfobacterales bacterium]
MEERMVRVLQKVWNAISGDIGGENQYFSGKDAGLMAADFVEIHGGDKEAAEAFSNLTYKKKMAVIKKAFPMKGKAY